MKRRIKCKHQWTKQSEVTTESTFEHAMNTIVRTTARGQPMSLPHQLCHDGRKHIVILSCDLCGKLEKFVTDLGE